MDLPTPEEIEQAVRRGCRGLPEWAVELNVAEALEFYAESERGEGYG